MEVALLFSLYTNSHALYVHKCVITTTTQPSKDEEL